MKTMGENISPTRVAQNATSLCPQNHMMATALPDPTFNSQEGKRTKDLIHKQLYLLHGKGCGALHHWPELSPMATPGRRYLRKSVLSILASLKRARQGKSHMGMRLSE